MRRRWRRSAGRTAPAGGFPTPHAALEALVDAVVARDHEQVLRWSVGGDVAFVRERIEGWGRPFVAPPPEVLRSADCLERTRDDHWSLFLYLWDADGPTEVLPQGEVRPSAAGYVPVLKMIG